MRRTGRPVFLTLSERGTLLFTEKGTTRVPTIQVRGEVDPVGAGDSISAGVVASLAAGASLVEAGTIGNLTASVTVQQLGTTGTATPAQILQRYREVARGL